MMRKLLRAKIHRATVTGADLHYEGSVTIDRELMDRTDLVDHEAVHVWNVTNGERFETYVIPGKAGSGVVCINGAAAHKVSRGDLVIIAAFSWMDEAEARAWEPKVVFVDDQNRPVELRAERGGQAEVAHAFGAVMPVGGAHPRSKGPRRAGGAASAPTRLRVRSSEGR